MCVCCFTFGFVFLPYMIIIGFHLDQLFNILSLKYYD